MNYRITFDLYKDAYENDTFYRTDYYTLTNNTWYCERVPSNQSVINFISKLDYSLPRNHVECIHVLVIE